MTPEGFRARLKSLGFRFLRNVLPNESDGYVSRFGQFFTFPVPDPMTPLQHQQYIDYLKQQHELDETN